MKLIISLFISFQVYAHHKIQISYVQGKISNAESLRDIFAQKYQIPSHLIKIVNGGCEKISSGIINLCIDKDGELEIEQKNSELISSLLIFKRLY